MKKTVMTLNETDRRRGNTQEPTDSVSAAAERRMDGGGGGGGGVCCETLEVGCGAMTPLSRGFTIQMLRLQCFHP